MSQHTIIWARLMRLFKWLSLQFGHIWCLFVHGFIQDKHIMHKPYAPWECDVCGRKWEL